MSTFNVGDLNLFIPEFFLIGSILALFVGDLIIKAPVQKRVGLTMLALIGLAGTLIATFHLHNMFSQNLQAPVSAFTGQIAVDPFASICKILFVLITSVCVITATLSQEIPKRHLGEYFALLLSVCLGMFLMASANDLLMMYLAIELVSIVSYALAGYRLRDKRSSEAALKYVIYGGAASGVMLFGMSLLYGLVGTTEFTSIHYAINQWYGSHLGQAIPDTSFFPMTFLLSMVFIFAGIGYKIAVVPFHMWSPDVYEGAPTPFTGFLSVGPKAAGFVLLSRFFIDVLVPTDTIKGFATNAQGVMESVIQLPLPAMIGIIAAVTMTVGNLAAIPQMNVKRMLAYSSIAHAGYLLMGFVVLSEASMLAVIFYLVIYFIMNIGAFTVCQAVRDHTGGEMIQDFQGLGQRAPVLAIAMMIFLLSLTGLPPLAGFIGKFYIFAAVIAHGGYWYWVLAVVAVINSAISLYYYMRVGKTMFFDSALQESRLQIGRGYLALCSVFAILILVLFIYWTPITRPIEKALKIYRSLPATALAKNYRPAQKLISVEANKTSLIYKLDSSQ